VSASASSRHPMYTEETDIIREQIRRFCEREIIPHGEQWEEEGTFPRELYTKAGEAGLLGLGFGEAYGGAGGGMLYYCLAREELSLAGFAGVRVGLMAHGIGLPPVMHNGSEEMKRRVAPAVLSGKRIICLAISEPEAGSDVANLRTVAKRDDDHFIVNGSKMFISNGVRADYYTTAVRTGGQGMDGLSLLLIERDTPGLSTTSLKKSGWWTSDTAAIYFDDCRVPAANLIGAENAGFKGIMNNFNIERLGIVATVLGQAKCVYEATRKYTAERKTFGKHLREHQVVRHKLIDMATAIQAMEANLDAVLWRVLQGETCIPEIAMLKNFVTGCHERICSEAVQLHGGAGIIRGHEVERAFRESKILSIGGGSTEVMKDLAARQLGL